MNRQGVGASISWSQPAPAGVVRPPRRRPRAGDKTRSEPAPLAALIAASAFWLEAQPY
jgi:hypothetical protein